MYICNDRKGNELIPVEARKAFIIHVAFVQNSGTLAKNNFLSCRPFACSCSLLLEVWASFPRGISKVKNVMARVARCFGRVFFCSQVLRCAGNVFTCNDGLASVVRNHYLVRVVRNSRRRFVGRMVYFSSGVLFRLIGEYLRCAALVWALSLEYCTGSCCCAHATAAKCTERIFWIYESLCGHNNSTCLWGLAAPPMYSRRRCHGYRAEVLRVGEGWNTPVPGDLNTRVVCFLTTVHVLV